MPELLLTRRAKQDLAAITPLLARYKTLTDARDGTKAPLDAALNTSAASEPMFDTLGEAAVQPALPELDAPSSPLEATKMS